MHGGRCRLSLLSLGHWVPLASCDRGNELVQSLWRKRQRLPLLRALICRHEHSHNVESVVEREQRLFFAKKDPNEVAILCLVTVGRRLVGDDRHLSHLGILLLDEIFSFSATNLTRE